MFSSRLASRARSYLLAALTLALVLAASLCSQTAVAGTPDTDVTGWPMESRDAYHSGTTTNHLGGRITPDPLWEAPSRANGSPVIGDGKIFYWGMNDSIVAANPADGGVVWATNPNLNSQRNFRGFAYDSGHLYAADKDYTQMYRSADGAYEAARYTYTTGWFSPTVKAGVAYSTGIVHCEVFAFDSATLNFFYWIGVLPDECVNGPGVAVKNFEFSLHA